MQNTTHTVISMEYKCLVIKGNDKEYCNNVYTHVYIILVMTNHFVRVTHIKK